MFHHSPASSANCLSQQNDTKIVKKSQHEAREPNSVSPQKKYPLTQSGQVGCSDDCTLCDVHNLRRSKHRHASQGNVSWLATAHSNPMKIKCNFAPQLIERHYQGSSQPSRFGCHNKPLLAAATICSPTRCLAD